MSRKRWWSQRVVAWTTLACSLWGLLSGPSNAHADLFGDARRQTPLTLSHTDTAGVSLRGGLQMQTYLPPQTVTLLQTQAQIGGSCGAFDFYTSLRQTFEEIPELFETAGEALLAQMPMLILCYASPTLCDLYKHFQALVNATLQARYAQCQEIQHAMMAAGLRLRGGESARCLEEQEQQGASLSIALEYCVGGVDSLRSPTGVRSGRVELVKETLEAAGADRTVMDLARSLLGEVTLTAGGRSLGAEAQRPAESLHRRYEDFRISVADRLREAVAALAAGYMPPSGTLQELALPGQPLPHAALQALVALRADQVRYESFLAKLAAGLALTRLTWDVQELHSQLAGAAAVNQQLTEEERHVLQQRLAGLQQELARVVQQKEVAERHVLPVLEALLAEYAATQAEATRLGLGIPAAQTPPPTPFRGQLPGGYGP
jgi:hypothetical protein